MSEKTTDSKSNEQSLVKLYMELTGTTESDARSVLMYAEPADDEPGGDTGPKASPPSEN